MDDQADYLDQLARKVASLERQYGALQRIELEARLGDSASARSGGGDMPSMTLGADAAASTLGNIIPTFGQTNLLHNPLFQGMDSILNVTAVAAPRGPFWSAVAVLNSGTLPDAGASAKYGRSRPNDNPYASAVCRLIARATTATYDLDLYVYPTIPFLAGAIGTLPYLVGAIRSSFNAETVDAAFSVARVRLELYDTVGATVVAFSDWQNLSDLNGSYESRQQVVAAAYGGESIRWRYRLNLVKTTSANVELEVLYGEPQLHFSYSPDAGSFAPALGTWTPDALGIPGDTDEWWFLRVADNEIRFGPGDAASDIAISRLEAGVLHIRRPSGADGLILEIEGQASAPGASSADHGRLWWNSSTLSWWQTDSAGTSLNLNNTGTGASFPASPSEDDLWYRTDLDMWFQWRSVRWVCTCFHELPLVMISTTTLPLAATTTARFGVALPVVGGMNLLVDGYDCMFYVTGGTALGASHKWVGTVARQPDGTVIGTINIDSGASDAYRNAVDPSDDDVDLTSSQVGLTLDWTKTGTPGDLTQAVTVRFRYIAT